MTPSCTSPLRRFFRLFDDVYAPGRWHLGSPIDDHGDEVDDFGYFTQGHAVEDPGLLYIPYDVPGQPLDFSLAGLNVPIVHARVAEVFLRLAPQAVQLLPAEIEGHREPYFILVVTHRLRCIDERTTHIERWTLEDDIPDMVGLYRSIQHLRIDKHRVGASHLFRPEGWESFILVSQQLRSALEHIQATGVKFLEEV